MRKTILLAEVVALIPDGASLMIGGFMGGGSPLRLIDELVHQCRSALTIVRNDTARPGVGIGIGIGIGKPIDAGLVRKLITSHIGTNPLAQRKVLDGELQVELVSAGNAGRTHPLGRFRPGWRAHAYRSRYAGGRWQAPDPDRTW